MTPDFVAALYEAALEPDGLQALVNLVGGYLGVDAMAVNLADACLLTDVALNRELADSQAAYLDQHVRCSAGDTRYGVSLVTKATPAAAVSVHHRSELAVRDRPTYRGSVAAPSGLQGFRPRAGRSCVSIHHRPLQAILPYLKRALQLRLRGQQTSAAAQSPAMAKLTFGALICDGEGRVAHANPAAEALALGSIGIAIKPRDRVITAVVPAEAARLAQLIHAAARANQAGSIVLSGRDGVSCLMVLIAPSGGRVLLALRQIGALPSFNATRLAELFRLSPAQADLAIKLYEGKSFAEIAVERGVKVTTLRTHFTEILSRTGSKSLRDLVRLLGSIPPLV